MTRVARARTGDIHYFSNLFDVGSPCDATIRRLSHLTQSSFKADGDVVHGHPSLRLSVDRS
jgi:hypothetical protein